MIFFPKLSVDIPNIATLKEVMHIKFNHVKHHVVLCVHVSCTYLVHLCCNLPLNGKLKETFGQNH